MTKAHILYVDDEPNNLVAFKANYRRYYEIHTAESAEQGKRILKEHNIHIIITDQRMPEITGIQFLESIIKEYPDPMRILLTAYADVEAVIEAINKGQVYRYTLKPFNTDELKKIIDEAYSIYSFKEHNKKLLEKYRKIFEESSDAIFLVNAQGKLVDFNDATIDLLKYSRNQLNNIDHKDIIDDPDVFGTIMDELNREGVVKNLEVKLKSKTSDKIDCLISINAIKGANSETIGYQGIIKDFTKQKRMTNLLVRETIDLQEKERDWFARDLHDNISQQLASINFYLQTLQSINSTESGNTLSKKLAETSNSLNKVLNEIRDLCYKIMPRTIIGFGLVDSINDFCRKVSSTEKSKVSFEAENEIPVLDKSLQITLFRAIQELTHAAMEIGEADNISIHMKHADNNITISMDNNGKNPYLSAEKKKELKTLISRIESYDGELKLSALANQGMYCQIIVPVLKDNSKNTD